MLLVFLVFALGHLRMGPTHKNRSILITLELDTIRDGPATSCHAPSLPSVKSTEARPPAFVNLEDRRLVLRADVQMQQSMVLQNVSDFLHHRYENGKRRFGTTSVVRIADLPDT